MCYAATRYCPLPNNERPSRMELDEGLKQLVIEWVEGIDERLAAQNVPLESRVLLASALFAEHAIIDVPTEVKRQFFASPDFRPFYQFINGWYANKYGAALKGQGFGGLIGTVLHRGVPFELHIPSTTSKVETPGESAWLQFPASVSDGEVPTSWLVAPPNLEQMPTDEKEDFTRRIVATGTALRTIRLNLMTATLTDDTSREWKRHIVPHLTAAAKHIKEHAAGIACWEVHLAVEKSLKLMALQKTGIYAKIHDLRKLLAQCPADLGKAVDASLLDVLPEEKAIMQLRYGEGVSIALEKVYEIYDAGLSVVAQCTGVLQRNAKIHDAAFLIKKPPFLPD
jgi:HEPN domain-containing protein